MPLLTEILESESDERMIGITELGERVALYHPTPRLLIENSTWLSTRIQELRQIARTDPGRYFQIPDTTNAKLVSESNAGLPYIIYKGKVISAQPQPSCTEPNSRPHVREENPAFLDG